MASLSLRLKGTLWTVCTVNTSPHLLHHLHGTTVRFCAHTCFVPQTFHRFRIVAAKYASSSMHALRSAKYWQNVLNPLADGFRPPLSNAVKK